MEELDGVLDGLCVRARKRERERNEGGREREWGLAEGGEKRGRDGKRGRGSVRFEFLTSWIESTLWIVDLSECRALIRDCWSPLSAMTAWRDRPDAVLTLSPLRTAESTTASVSWASRLGSATA